MKYHVYGAPMLGAYRQPQERLMSSYDDADAAYADFTAAGLNMLSNVSFSSDPEKLDWVIRACEKYGVRFLPYLPGSFYTGTPDGEYLAKLLRSPNFMGFGMSDEPSAKDFASLAAVKDKLRALVGDKIIMMNLFPLACGAETLGMDPALDSEIENPNDPYETTCSNRIYKEHVKQFLDVYKPDLLSYDYYAIIERCETDDEFMRRINYGLLKNMSIFAADSRERGIPFWSVLQAWAYNEKIAPRVEHLRWQLGLNNVFCAQATIYFVYQNDYEEGTGPELWREAPLDRAGNKTATYDSLKQANTEFLRFAHYLEGYASLGVLLINPDDSIRYGVDSRLVLGSFYPLKSVETELPLIIGCCEKDGRPALYVANASYKLSGDVSLSLTAKSGCYLHSKDYNSAIPGDKLSFALDKGESLFIEL